MMQPSMPRFNDLTSPSGYQFEFFCDCCGKSFKSTFRPVAGGVAYKPAPGQGGVKGFFGGIANGVSSVVENGFNTIGAGGQRPPQGGENPQAKAEYEAAFQYAQAEVAPNFGRCPQCGGWVCADCWDGSANMCSRCSGAASHAMPGQGMPGQGVPGQGYPSSPAADAAMAAFRGEAAGSQGQALPGGARAVEQPPARPEAQRTMPQVPEKACPRCGHGVADLPFCPYCGASLAPTRACPACSREVPAEFSFCGYCGAEMAEKKRVCPVCGAQMPPDMAFCGLCGARLEPEEGDEPSGLKPDDDGKADTVAEPSDLPEEPRSE